MSSTLARFYEHVKGQPCIVCGKRGVDVAHILPVSKYLGDGARHHRDWSSRSHKGPRAYSAIPLCRNCHNAVHTFGEDWLDQQLEHMGGRMFAYAVANRLLAEVVEEYCDQEATEEAQAR